ncbi:LAQU0S16e02322g1_1 [Lachancea quebecensis]|uniref:LAQU0S16e02322g1_1 n=1 Tax=Lachancea quebecensis TaxID=1654605 RepID=A0A0P1KWM8_9SACH|nr:LAQU0S16e02322g1_1 [Lachancea quebecensis]
MAHAKFIVPANLTLRQTLSLLLSIVDSQYRNCKELREKATGDPTILRKLHRALSEALTYLNEGFIQIENFYKVKSVLSLKNPDVLNIVNDLRIFDHDLRENQKAVEEQLLSGQDEKNQSLSVSNSHFSLSRLLKKTKISSGRKEELRRTEEEKKAKEVEELKKQRKLDEARALVEKETRNRKAEEEQAKALEMAVKRQVEKEMATRAGLERAAIAQRERSHKTEFEKPQRAFERTSLDVKRSPRRSADQMRRRSLDGGARSRNGSGGLHVRQGSDTSLSAMGNVSKAANLAWSQMKPPLSKPNTRTKKPIILTDGNQSHTTKTKYEYIKPTIKRPSINVPRKASAPRRENSEGGKNREAPTRSKSPRSPDSPAQRSFSPSARSEKSVTPDLDLSPQEKRLKHVMETLEGVDPEACQHIINDILVMGEKVYWDDIAGLNSAKNSLKETVVYPFLRPDLFKGLREPISGMLLFGPPGTGKSMIGKAVATESRSTFFSISASSLLSKYLGESEKLVRALFYLARRLSPSIIFIDEIDSLLTSRSDNENESSRRIKTEVLIQWSSLSSATAREREEGDIESGRVLVLAATNLPWAIDEAARRRFTRRLYIPLPEHETRVAHLKKLLLHQKNNLTDSDFDVIGTLTEGYSGSDITALAKDAAMEPIRELGDKLIDVDFSKIRGINLQDFERAMLTIKKSVSPESLEKFETWASDFGSQGA